MTDIEPIGVRPDLVSVYLSSLRSPESVRTMRSSLDILARLMSRRAGIDGPVTASDVDWASITFEQAMAVASATSAAGWSVATVNRHRAAMRGVVRAGKYSGAINPATADHICDVALRNLRPDHDGLNPASRVVTKAELDAIFATALARDDNLARRDVAALAVLARTGIRRSELTGLRIEDWRPASNEMLVLHGKGGMRRKAWVTGWTVQALETWLDVRGDKPGALFTRVYRGGHIDRQMRPITPQAVYGRIHAMASEAGVEPFAPHDLRRRVATLLLDEGHDVSTVAKILGHRQITTTAVYDRRGEEAAAVASADNLIFTDIPARPAS